jgi:hypothetical protein
MPYTCAAFFPGPEPRLSNSAADTESILRRINVLRQDEVTVVREPTLLQDLVQCALRDCTDEPATEVIGGNPTHWWHLARHFPALWSAQVVRNLVLFLTTKRTGQVLLWTMLLAAACLPLGLWAYLWTNAGHALVCSGHGSPDRQGACVCRAGRNGTECHVCAHGYFAFKVDSQLNDITECKECQHCRGDCAGGHCTCRLGQTGLDCATCLPGYVKSDGTCRPPSACIGGRVVDNQCQCEPGFAGPLCDQCDASSYVAIVDGRAEATTAANYTPLCVKSTLWYLHDHTNGVCDSPWTGDRCEQCAHDYELNRDNACIPKTCPPNQYKSNTHGSCAPCQPAAHGKCQHDGYVCDPGWSGDTCTVPLSDHFLTHGHAVPCKTVPAVRSPGTCDDRYEGLCCDRCRQGRTGSECKLNVTEVCDTRRGTLLDDASVCQCPAGWTGDACDRCAAGYFARDDTCVPHSACAHGVLSGPASSTSNATCTCLPGWAGAICDRCAAPAYGLHLNTTCVPCGPHGNTDVDGSCGCHDGWAGAHCDHCSQNFMPRQVQSEQTCVPCNTSSSCLGGNCTDGRCVCNPGSFGEACDQCGLGYLDVAGKGCVACPGVCTHGRCTVVFDPQTQHQSSKCVCDDGWAGTLCDRCAADYVRMAYQCVNCSALCDAKGGMCEKAADGSTTCKCRKGYAGRWCTKCNDTHALVPPAPWSAASESQYCAPKEQCELGGLGERDADGFCVCRHAVARKTVNCSPSNTTQHCATCPDESGTLGCQPGFMGVFCDARITADDGVGGSSPSFMDGCSGTQGWWPLWWLLRWYRGC